MKEIFVKENLMYAGIGLITAFIVYKCIEMNYGNKKDINPLVKPTTKKMSIQEQEGLDEDEDESSFCGCGG